MSCKAIFLLASLTVSSAKEIIGYYASWQWYDRAKLADPMNLDFSKLTVVNFAFFQTDENGYIYGTDPWGDAQTLFGPGKWDGEERCSWDEPQKPPVCTGHVPEKGLIERVHAAGKKILPSIGGWTLSNTFPVVAASDASRKNFASQCAALVESYGFDGIDIDWEYPGFADHNGGPADKANFVKLLAEIRSALPSDLMLTAALPCGPTHIENIDISAISALLTELNLMSYDLHGAWDAVSGVNAPLYPQGFGQNVGYDIDSCVSTYLGGGAPNNKLNIGLPFYGRSFAGANGLNQPHDGADVTHWAIDEGTPQFYHIQNEIENGNLISVRDEKSMTQFGYFADGSGVVSFDDERSICDKVHYVQQQMLNGFIIWEISGDLMDDLSTPLLDVVNNKLLLPNYDCAKYHGHRDTTAKPNVSPPPPVSDSVDHGVPDTFCLEKLKTKHKKDLFGKNWKDLSAYKKTSEAPTKRSMSAYAGVYHYSVEDSDEAMAYYYHEDQAKQFVILDVATGDLNYGHTGMAPAPEGDVSCEEGDGRYDCYFVDREYASHLIYVTRDCGAAFVFDDALSAADIFGIVAFFVVALACCAAICLYFNKTYRRLNKGKAGFEHTASNDVEVDGVDGIGDETETL